MDPARRCRGVHEAQVMDVTCPKCGATNRNTSRFCARCGEALPAPSENAAQKADDELSLPWLQAVQERAVIRTGQLNPSVLREESGGAQEQPEPTSQQPPAAQTVSSDASQQSAVPPEQAQDNRQEQDNAGEAPPEWVVGILEPGATAAQQKAEEAYEPEELAHIMPWLGGQQGEGGEAPPGQQSLPPWLNDVTVQETLETRPTGAAQQAQPAGDPELAGLQPFIPPELQEQVGQKEPEAAAEAAAPSQEKLPDWIKRIETKKAVEPEPEEAVPTIDRFTPVTRVVLSPTETLGSPMIRDVPVKPPRPGAVETLAALIQSPPNSAPQAVPSPTSILRPETVGAASGRSRLSMWFLPDGLIYLIILAVLLTVLIVRPPFGQVSAPGVTDAILFYNAVDSAPKDKPALVVFDWDASRSAEMSTLSAAVVNHLMARHIPFVTLSTVPQGPGFAEQITSDAANDTRANYGYVYGRDYLVLGYLPGGEAALRSLGGDITDALPLDYVNSGLVANTDIARAGKLRSVQDFGIIINLAANESSLRTWVEQVAARTGVPMVAAVPQALEPLARPYRDIPRAGLRALVSGQTGAAQYVEQLTSHNVAAAAYNTETLENNLNAQSVAQLLVALAILGAFVYMGTRRILRR